MRDIDGYLAENKDRFEEELKDLLRIPSVSADSRHNEDTKKACQFVADQVKLAGIDAEIVPTAGHPLIVGEKIVDKSLPTVLLYGHYDVQPPDPLDLWETGPFEPTVRNGNIYARGATDDKGQMYAHVKALEVWKKTQDKLPINIKVLIEGEEEVGSKNIGEYLTKNKDRLACDYVVISDCSMFAPDQPAITYGLKGLAYFEIFVQGPNRDLHSGTFGGSVQNPINALCEIIASMKDANGRILLPGFYNDVVELSQEERDQFKQLGFNEEDYRKDLGVDKVFGEAKYTTLERKWIRPTCDVNGIFGGYQGEGAKTVLPAKGGCKISFRLVPNQDPHKVEEQLKAHVKKVAPVGVEARVVSHHGGEPVVVPLDSYGIRAASKALELAYGKKPFYIREGGSIPIVSNFKRELNADSLLIGFGLSDDNTHSPNEKFCLKDYHRGIKTIAHLFEQLAIAAKQ